MNFHVCFYLGYTSVDSVWLMDRQLKFEYKLWKYPVIWYSDYLQFSNHIIYSLPPLHVLAHVLVLSGNSFTFLLLEKHFFSFFLLNFFTDLQTLHFWAHLHVPKACYIHTLVNWYKSLQVRVCYSTESLNSRNVSIYICIPNIWQVHGM